MSLRERAQPWNRPAVQLIRKGATRHCKDWCPPPTPHNKLADSLSGFTLVWNLSGTASLHQGAHQRSYLARRWRTFPEPWEDSNPAQALERGSSFMGPSGSVWGMASGRDRGFQEQKNKKQASLCSLRPSCFIIVTRSCSYIASTSCQVSPLFPVGPQAPPWSCTCISLSPLPRCVPVSGPEKVGSGFQNVKR